VLRQPRKAQFLRAAIVLDTRVTKGAKYLDLAVTGGDSFYATGSKCFDLNQVRSSSVTGSCVSCDLSSAAFQLPDPPLQNTAELLVDVVFDG
jgi:hypothetical protein